MNTVIFLGALLTAFSGYNPDVVIEQVVSDTPDLRYDFNNDGEVNIMDVIAANKHRNTPIEINIDTIDMLVPAEYYEIDFINGTPCRKYDFIATEETTIHIYYETEEKSGGLTLIAKPEIGITEVIWD